MCKLILCFYLVLAMIIFIPFPASASVKTECQTDLVRSEEPIDSGSDFSWKTGIRTTGDWPIGTNAGFFLRSKVWADNTTDEWGGLLERCYLQYQYQSIRLNLGRQAVNWGIGRLFRPTDILTPRMVYNQEETRSGMDLVSIYWATSPLTITELAVGKDLNAGRVEWRIHNTNLRVSGFNLPSGKKMIGMDIQGGLADFYGETVFSWDERLSQGRPALMLGWKNYFSSGSVLYLEYFWNGGGSVQNYHGQNYLGAGMDIPWDQLTTINLASITNLDDMGTKVSGTVQMQLNDHLDFNSGLTLFLGDPESEFRMAAQDSHWMVNFQMKYYF